ncbi:MAG: hypothetical protein ACKESB_03215 [Candidatus Hodgkinia cicadicola]
MLVIWLQIQSWVSETIPRNWLANRRMQRQIKMTVFKDGRVRSKRRGKMTQKNIFSVFRRLPLSRSPLPRIHQF